MMYVVLLLLVSAMSLGFVRLVRGPSAADRVVALDLIATAAVGALAAYAVAYEQPVFLDIAVLLALITFVGTVGFASFIERRVQA